MKEKMIRTTLSLPAELIAAIDFLIQKGKIKNRSQFLTDAISKEIIALKKAEIDAAFAELAEVEKNPLKTLPTESELVNASGQSWQK